MFKHAAKSRQRTQRSAKVKIAAIVAGCALVAGGCYALIGLVGRLVTPWSQGVAS